MIKQTNTGQRLSRKNENGFSLIDVVVTVAILVALSVGGFFAYNGLVANAKQGAVDFAASNVYKSAAVYEQDGDSSTSACSAVDEYNGSSEGIAVELQVPDLFDPTATQVYYGVGEANSYNCV